MSHPSAARAEAAVTLREAVEADLSFVQAIYAHHVTTGFGSFEEVPPSVDEMRRRHAEIVKQHLPYVVAELEGHIVGYAYAGPFRPRSAYRYSVEDSVYVAPQAQRRGIGRQLLDELVERCTKLGYRQMMAVIGDSANKGSIGAHAAAGFMEVARLPAIGFKFGRWVDIVMMQRPLGAGDSTLP
jgi:phosphinothricin acetyltransferase